MLHPRPLDLKPCTDPTNEIRALAVSVLSGLAELADHLDRAATLPADDDLRQALAEASDVAGALAARLEEAVRQ